MNNQKLKEILEKFAQGSLTLDAVLAQLKDLPYKDIGCAKIDNHRMLRQNMPEVIFSPGKTAAQIVKIAQELKANHEIVIATKIDEKQAENVLSILPEANYHAEAKMLILGEIPKCSPSPFIAILSAGTADLPVAEEAALMLACSGIAVEKIYDVGVAGIHRLFDHIDKLQKASCVIVVAGMDGALASVAGGLVGSPIIAVPTSIGYGASFQGLAPLLTMLNSCAAGVTVVNIDNGFGAASAALRLLTTAALTHHLLFPGSAGVPPASGRMQSSPTDK